MKFSFLFSILIYSLVLAPDAMAVKHKLKVGLYQLQGKWGDGVFDQNDRGSFFEMQAKELSTLSTVPPQTLNIWFLQYEYQLNARWGAIIKGGYHSNRLHPYGVVLGENIRSGSVYQVPRNNAPPTLELVHHDGLEDFEVTGTYQLGKYKLGLGIALPLFQAPAPTENTELARGWDGFRSYRTLAFLETFQYGQWLQIKADVITVRTKDSRNQVGDANIQLLDYYGFPIWGPTGGFVGQTFSYNWYHWKASYSSQQDMFRREFLWDWTLGLSIATPWATIKGFSGITPWASAQVREDNTGKGFISGESSRNIVLGFDISTEW